MATLQETLEGLSQRLAERPEKLAGAAGVYQLDLTGEEGSSYSLIVADGKGEIQPGAAKNPGVVVTMTAADFMAMVAGKLDGMTAYMSGRLKIKGDMGLALKLQSLLS